MDAWGGGIAEGGGVVRGRLRCYDWGDLGRSMVEVNGKSKFGSFWRRAKLYKEAYTVARLLNSRSLRFL